MRYFPGAFILVFVFSVVPLVFAADTGSQKAPTCSEQPGGGKIESIAKDVKTAIEQSDKTSHDSVIVTPQGQVSVISQCNPECIQGKVRKPDGTPSDKTCPAGSVRMTLPGGQTVSCSKDTDACGKSVESLKSSSEMLDALAKGDTQKATQLATNAFRNIPEIQAGLQKASQDILNSAFSDQLPEQYKVAGKEIQQGFSDSIKALAEGDLAKVEAIGKKLSENPAIQEFTKNPQNFVNGLLNAAPAEMQQMTQQLTPFVCSVFGSEACAQVQQLTGAESTFAGGGQPAVYNGTQPLLPMANGTRVDPVALGLRAAELYKQELAGRVFPELGMSNPSPEEFAAGAVALAKIESGFKTGANEAGQLIRFTSTPSGECSYGLYQMCPFGSDRRYGVSTPTDLVNPEKSLNGLVQIAKQGQLYKYFGPIQRGMVAPRADQAYADLQPYLSGGTPYTGTFSNVASGGGLSGFLNGTGITGAGSPLSFAGGFAQSLGSLMGGGGGNPTSLISGLLGGSSGGFGNILGSIGKMFGGLGSSAGGSSGGSATAVAQPPIANTEIPTPTNTITNTSAIVTPVITVAKPGAPISRGGSFVLAWAAVGVSTTQLCQLVDSSGTVRASGNSGSFGVSVPASTTANTIIFELRCVPKDTRASASSAKRTISVSIQQ